MRAGRRDIDLSIIFPADSRSPGLAGVLSQVRSACEALSIVPEVILCVSDVDVKPAPAIANYHAGLALSSGGGYGAAINAGLRQAMGKYILVMDADQESYAELLAALWSCRDTADVIIASRYVPGARAIMPPIRSLFSRMLNAIFSRGLDLPVKDMSSGFRLYRAEAVKNLELTCEGYDVLQEVLVKALMAGHRIREIPFAYRSSDNRLMHITRFGAAYVRTYARLWRMRNSISSADYDARAYNAIMPPQRYWQRQRYKHITRLVTGKGRCLDVGCGSSRIIGALPTDSVILDIAFRKLRFDRQYSKSAIQGSILALPIADRSFPCVLCSQVIEHVKPTDVLNELDRVLQPGGFLILGTPDYSRWQWIMTERLYKILLPQAYADEHITHYTYDQLIDEFVRKRNYSLEAVRYILKGEMVLGLRKPVVPF